MNDREEVCAALQALGIQAQVSERGRLEEEIDTGFTTKSSDVIDIVEGPIRWVNFTFTTSYVRGVLHGF